MVKRLTNPFLGAPTPLGSLLTAAGQRLSAELDAALRAAGFPDLRSAHAPVFMAIDPEGTRVTELARRTRMTKQAVGELIRYLAAHGYVTVAPDPDDGRARRVSLTDAGWRAIDTGERVIGDFDQWLNDAIGADVVVQLRQALDRIIATDPADRR
ncbi:MarR family transcriptional regulator [Actinoplanes sp. NPDC051633]|uniref:MarR family winged helix-turn-helix transcriptional regulator n=1 Tax=Actinoplanes sp. NPDC051633 TaxID=3155670 RepID=UPI003421DDF7